MLELSVDMDDVVHAALQHPNRVTIVVIAELLIFHG